jgi:hypothetical protein
LFARISLPNSTTNPEVVSLENPTEVDPSLILMTTNELGTYLMFLYSPIISILNMN